MTRIFVEVTRAEGLWLALVLPGASGLLHPSSGVSEQRLSDRFDMAANNDDEPVRFMGEAVFIQREMT